MRNSEFLDNPVPEDSKIGDLRQDADGHFRLVNGEKIYQSAEETQEQRDTNLAINRVRASGMRPSEYLKSLYR